MDGKSNKTNKIVYNGSSIVNVTFAAISYIQLITTFSTAAQNGAILATNDQNYKMALNSTCTIAANEDVSFFRQKNDFSNEMMSLTFNVVKQKKTY